MLSFRRKDGSKMQIVTGTGLVLIAGAVCLIAAVILLIRAAHTDWTVSVSDYDKSLCEAAIAPHVSGCI